MISKYSNAKVIGFMLNVKINGKNFSAGYGDLLSDILIKNGISHTHICGGKGICKKCVVLVDGKEELSCKFTVHSDIDVTIPDNGEVLSFNNRYESENATENMCFVLDIGTTTLELALVSTDDNKILRTIRCNNPQKIFGADVMSRIDFCSKNGTEQLQKVLIEEINKMIDRIDSVQVKKLFVAGNTTMLHLFFGIDCTSSGTAPYTPVFLESKKITSDRINGIEEIISLPCIHTFTGADIVAGLNFTETPKNNKYNLLVDLGTNAEIVLFSKDNILCTSAAAGPCFEGANISCGMSATDGAIYSYGKGKICTINNTIPKGICGTGLIDIIAELLSDGIIENTGFMECGEFLLSEDVCITQDDVQQYLLAKSAVFSGICSLAKNADIGFDDIEKIYISGGFSVKLNIENAVKTGLIPKELKEKFIPISNSSLLGSVKYACENNNLQNIVNKSRYIDLSSDKYFSDLFIKNLSFGE